MLRYQLWCPREAAASIALENYPQNSGRFCCSRELHALQSGNPWLWMVESGLSTGVWVQRSGQRAQHYSTCRSQRGQRVPALCAGDRRLLQFSRKQQVLGQTGRSGGGSLAGGGREEPCVSQQAAVSAQGWLMTTRG